MKKQNDTFLTIGYSFIAAVALIFCFLSVNAIIETQKEYNQCLDDARPTIQCEIERTL